MVTTLPHIPILEVATPTSADLTDANNEYPLLTVIVTTDSVGPQASNQQPKALDIRTETLRLRSNLLIDVVNAIDTNYLHRDGTQKQTNGLPDPHFMRGDLDMTDPTPITGAAFKVIGVANGTDLQDAVTVIQLTALQTQVDAIEASLAVDFMLRDGTLSMLGNLNMASQQVENLGAAVNPNDAVRKTEFDVTTTALQTDHVRRDGSQTMLGDLDMGGNKIVGILTTGFPNLASDIAPKKYVDDTFNSIAAVASGTITAFAGATVPAGWQLCDGRVLDTTAFAALFTAIQFKYGGSGSSFNVPDLRGRLLAGFDNYDGKVTTSPPAAAGAALRLDDFGNSSDFGGAFGAQNHVLTIPELPSHTHSYDDAYMATSAGAGLQGVLAPDSVDTFLTVSPQPTTDATGGGTAHQNVQPTMVMVFIVKE